ncbi:MAG: pinensin family lanthipeptide [Bacteroidota bacterium]
MAKKVQLTNLKIKSFVIQLSATEQKTAKGGLHNWKANSIETPTNHRDAGHFTEHKSQRSPANFSITRRIR